MDLKDPSTWPTLLRAFIDAPALLPLFGIVAVVVWWFKGHLDKAALEGVKAQIDALRERLALAQDKEKAVEPARVELEKQIEHLKAQVAAGRSPKEVQLASSGVGKSLSNLKELSNAVTEALADTPQREPLRVRIHGDKIVGWVRRSPPDLGKPDDGQFDEPVKADLSRFVKSENETGRSRQGAASRPTNKPKE